MGTQYHKKILTNKVYTGDLIQRQGEMVSYKVKKYRLLPKSEHLIKEKHMSQL